MGAPKMPAPAAQYRTPKHGIRTVHKALMGREEENEAVEGQTANAGNETVDTSGSYGHRCVSSCSHVANVCVDQIAKPQTCHALEQMLGFQNSNKPEGQLLRPLPFSFLVS